MAKGQRQATSRPRFSSERKQDLARLGLTPAAIAGLELTLPAVQPFLEARPAANAVREPLERLRDALANAVAVVEVLSDPPDSAHDEASRHLREQATRSGVPDLQARLSLLHAVSIRTLAVAPKEQRRPEISAAAVRLIYDALVTNGASDVTRGTTFDDIVAIAFEAATGGSRSADMSVERPVKAFRRTRSKDGVEDPLHEFLRAWHKAQDG